MDVWGPFSISKLFSLPCQLPGNTVITGSSGELLEEAGRCPKMGSRGHSLCSGLVPFQSAKASRSFQLSCPQVGDSLESTTHM